MTKKFKIMFLLSLSMFSIKVMAQNIKDGIKALDAEQFTKAGTIFENLSKTGTAENYYYLGYYNIKMERPDKAKAAFDNGIAADPKYALNYVGLGTIALQRDNKTEAKKYFDQATTATKSKDANVLFRIGEAYTYYPAEEPKRDQALAVTYLNSAAKIDAKNPDLYLALGDAYLIKNDGSNAEMNYMKVREVDSKSPRSYFRSGNVMIRTKAYQEALNLYNKGVELDPNYGPGFRQRAELYFMANQYDKAVADFKKYLEMTDNKVEAKFRFGKFLFLNAQNLQKDKKNDEALKSYTESNTIFKEVQSSIPDPVLYRLLGYTDYEVKDYEPGVKAMETFFSKADPKMLRNSDYVYYGKLLAATGNDSLATNNLLKVADADTTAEAAQLYEEIRLIYIKKNKWLKAAEYKEKALARKKDKVAINDYLILGQDYYKGNSFVKADTIFKKLIEKGASNPQAILLGYLYRARANSRLDNQLNPNAPKFTGLPFYEKYIELVGDDKDKYKEQLVESYKYNGGYHFIVKNDVKQAVEYWKKGLEISPDNADLKNNIQRATAPPKPTPKQTIAPKKTK